MRERTGERRFELPRAISMYMCQNHGSYACRFLQEECEAGAEGEEHEPSERQAVLLQRVSALQQRSDDDGSQSDTDAWEELMYVKAEQLEALMISFGLYGDDVYPQDAQEVKYITKQRGVSFRRKAEVLTELCTFVAELQQPDRSYLPPSASQESTESQVESEIAEDDRKAPHGKCSHAHNVIAIYSMGVNGGTEGRAVRKSGAQNKTPRPL